MPMELEHCGTARPFRAWLEECSLHAAPQPPAPTITLKLNVSVPALLDSGSTITLAYPSAMSQTPNPVEAWLSPVCMCVYVM